MKLKSIVGGDTVAQSRDKIEIGLRGKSLKVILSFKFSISWLGNLIRTSMTGFAKENAVRRQRSVISFSQELGQKILDKIRNL